MEKHNSSISNFKLFLFQILAPLLLILAVAGLSFNYYFEKRIILKSPVSGAFKVNRMIAETHPAEIPILGSSRAEIGLIPDSLGADYFNYGMSGTYFNVTLFFLEEECKKKKTRPWIIVNLDPFGLQYGLGDITAYLYHADEPKIKALLDTNYKPHFAVPFIKYFGHFENYCRLYLSDRIELTKVTNKGAMLDKNKLTQQEVEKMISQKGDGTPPFKIDATLKQRLLNIITTYPDRYFIFVIAPYYRSSSLVDDRKLVDGLVGQIKTYRNVSVFDFGTSLLSDSLFINASHVNFKGAIVYSRMLRDSLESLGVR